MEVWILNQWLLSKELCATTVFSMQLSDWLYVGWTGAAHTVHQTSSATGRLSAISITSTCWRGSDKLPAPHNAEHESHHPSGKQRGKKPLLPPLLIQTVGGGESNHGTTYWSSSASMGTISLLCAPLHELLEENFLSSTCPLNCLEGSSAVGDAHAGGPS